MIATGEMVERPQVSTVNGVLRAVAGLISFVFHPVFIPIYICLYLVYSAHLFPDRNDWQKKMVVAQYLVNYTILPVLAMLLAKGVGFVKSLTLPTAKERILPYVITEVFYFWAWYVAKQLHYPAPMILLSLSIFLSSCLGLIMNAYFKISMHGLAVGVLMGFAVAFSLRFSFQIGYFVSAAILIAGLVCTARLIRNDHEPFEVYAGVLGGVICVIISSFFA